MSGPKYPFMSAKTRLQCAPRLAEALKRVLPLADAHYNWREANGIATRDDLAAIDDAFNALREAGIE